MSVVITPPRRLGVPGARPPPAAPDLAGCPVARSRAVPPLEGRSPISVSRSRRHDLIRWGSSSSVAAAARTPTRNSSSASTIIGGLTWTWTLSTATSSPGRSGRPPPGRGARPQFAGRRGTTGEHHPRHHWASLGLTARRVQPGLRLGQHVVETAEAAAGNLDHRPPGHVQFAELDPRPPRAFTSTTRAPFAPASRGWRPWRFPL